MPVRPPEMNLGATVSEVQIAALRRFPDRIALVTDERRYTYREVEEEISRIIQLFKSVGLKREDGFAVLSANRAAVIFANWAGQAMGLRYTPLHPKGSEEDHLFCLEKGEISALVVDGDVFGDRGRAIAAAGIVRHIFVMGEGRFGVDMEAEAAKFDAGPVAIEARPEDVSNLYFTGGTTGRPKAAIHRHLTVNIAQTMTRAYWEWPEEVRFLIATPISHAAGAMLTPTLSQGGEFHLLSSYSPERFLETIERERITATFMVPTMIYDMLDKVDLSKYDLSSLQTIIYGASAISPTRLAEAITRMGPIFCQLYGQTEVPNLISYLSKKDHDLSRPHLLESCGIPLPPNQIRLIKPDGTIARQGEVGEICVRGPLAMDGYWDNPEETEQVFRGGWLHTGDVARQDEQGYLYIVDRLKDMVITGGFNVFTREVEDCIAKHPAVASVAVFGLPHERWGEEVVASVVLKDGMAVSEEEICDLVRQGKGAVQTPKRVLFANALPLTAVGKVDKKRLRAIHSPEAV